MPWHTHLRAALAVVGGALACLHGTSPSLAQTPAKNLFGAKRLPAATTAKAHGFYSKGCIQGAIAVPVDGPTWQAMRLSRNRRWGHPDLVKLVVRLSQDGRKVGWNGLLVGDLSQPRGGPMLTGHASHQIGLDADIWLTPMPDRRFTRQEREQVSATSTLAKRKNGKLDQNRIGPHFTQATYGIIKTAASYGEVERVLVHPTIKKELCRRAGGETDRRWLYKVRPYWGHHYHMHIRMACPAGSPNCRPQAKPKNDDGCGAELAYWHRQLNPPPRKPRKAGAPKPKPVKRKPKRQIRLGDLPRACTGVLSAAGPLNESAATLAYADGVARAPVLQAVQQGDAIGDLLRRSQVTTPTFRPQG